MSFRIIILLFIFLNGCGVKSKPVSPSEYRIPSLVDQYAKEENKKAN